VTVASLSSPVSGQWMSWYIATVLEHVLCYLSKLIITIAKFYCEHMQQIASYYLLTQVKIMIHDIMARYQ